MPKPTMTRLFECLNKDTVISSHVDEDKSGPYLRTKLVIERTELRFNPDFDESAMCDCGHVYYRHFDGYENNAPGCKYCHCAVWHAPMQKAGIIPYRLTNNQEIEMMFMISSDPYYGGPLPQISKGYVDPTDKGSRAAAIREGGEELGLKIENVRWGTVGIYDVYKGTIDGDEKQYTFALYACEVLDRDDFNQPHFETGAVVWMTAAQFQIHGREAHRELVRKAFIQIGRYHGYEVK